MPASVTIAAALTSVSILLVGVALAAPEHPNVRRAPPDGSLVSRAGGIGAEARALLAAQRALLHRHVAAARKRHTSGGTPVNGSDLILRAQRGTLAFDVAKQQVSSTSRLELEARVPSVATVTLYLQPLSGGGVPLIDDGEGTLEVVTSGNGLYTVTLRKALGVGERVSIAVTQKGQPQCQSQFLNIVSCMVSSQMIFSVGGSWQPMLYDVISNDVVEPETSVLAITVGKPLVVAASGLAGAVDDNGDGTRTFNFKGVGDRGFSFAAARYVVGEQPLGAAKKVLTHVQAANSGHVDAWRKQVAAIVGFHAARYGAYPHKSIGIAEVPDVVGAAFGPMMTVFMPTSSLAPDPAYWASTVTLAHELAHQWFGGLIGVGERYSPWLAEGFATFAESRFTATRAASALGGLDYAVADRRSKRLRVIYTLPAQYDVPLSSPQIYQVPSQAYVTLTYTKGALVVNMLRYALGGDKAFDAALRGVRADHQAKQLTVASLASSLARHSGVDVTKLLSRWVHQSGYATYSVSVDQPPRSGATSTAAGATIRVSSDRAHHLPLEVVLHTADGKMQRVRMTASADGRSFEHRYRGSAEVTRVEVDPDEQILRRVVGEQRGDVLLDGAVDGIDLIWTARAVGQRYAGQGGAGQGGAGDSFADWADVAFDGAVDRKDLDAVLDNFGKRTGGTP